MITDSINCYFAHASLRDNPQFTDSLSYQIPRHNSSRFIPWIQPHILEYEACFFLENPHATL